jgi:hypothetical protein
MGNSARPVLWHHTCIHSARQIGKQGYLVPGQVLLPEKVLPWPSHFVWLTDLPGANVAALGLTRTVITCDRTAYRYRVAETYTAVEPWIEVRTGLPAEWLDYLETPGVMLRHWWVSHGPVPVVLDQPPKPKPKTRKKR